MGDWIDRDAGDLTPCWPVDVLTDAIAAAHEEGARVTAHCFGEASLYDFAAAGTDCIEHATGLEAETIAQFAEQQIAIVPTLVNIATFPALAEPAKEKFPDYHRRMLALHERRYATIGAAHDAGIPIYLGTDAGGSLRHGLVADEALELTRAGPVRRRGAACRHLGRAGVAGPAGAGGGRRRRPRRLRRRPAARDPGPGRARAHRAPRPSTSPDRLGARPTPGRRAHGGARRHTGRAFHDAET